VAEWLNATVLKTTRQYYLCNLFNNLRYVLVPILGIKRPEFEGKCATGCATFGKVCNRINKTLGPTEEWVFLGHLRGLSLTLRTLSTPSRWITLSVSLKVVAEQLGQVDTKMVERYYGHLASGHIAQTFRALYPSWTGQGGEGQEADCRTDAPSCAALRASDS